MCFKHLIAAVIVALSLGATSAVVAQDFPVTISHVYGETIVDMEPQRVVSIGLNDHDFLYALGVAPVGVKEWWGDQAYATWPWAEDERTALGAEPEVLVSVDINVEWVAAQNPDLIIAVYSDIDADMYGLLSDIAPVVTRPEQYPLWGAPWQEQLRQIDLATSGGTDKAETIITRLDAKMAEIRNTYPQLQGKTASMADFRDGQFTLWSKTHAPTRFVTSFGTIFPDSLDALAGDDGWIYVSPENIEQIDLDVVVWPNGKRDEIEALSVYQNLRLAKEGRSVWMQDGTNSAAPPASPQGPTNCPGRCSSR